MTDFRSGHFLVSLAFVSMCSACAGPATQGPATEAERLEKVAQARQDKRDASMRLNMVAAERAEAEGRWNSVYRLSQTMFDADYKKAQSGYLLGKALGHLGNFSEQVIVYRKVRKLESDVVSDSEYLDALVRSLEQVDYSKVDERLELRLEIARLAPDHPSASNALIRSDMLSLADHYYSRRQWDEMLAQLQSLSASPAPDEQTNRYSERRVDFLYGVALWKTGQKSQARQKFEEYLQVGGRYANPVDRLRKVARFYDGEREDALAVELYERSMGLMSSAQTRQNVDLYLDLANRLLATGEPDDRERGKTYLLYYLDLALQDAREHRKDNIYYSVRRVAARYHLQQLSQDITERAVASGSASRYMVERLYKDTLRSGDKKRAQAILENYLNGSERDTAIWYVADWASEAGEYELAYRYMKRALDKHPDRHNWWYDLARIALKVGKKKQAVRALNNYLESDRTNSWDVQSAARFLQQAGMSDEAVEVLDGYRKKHPEDTRTAMYLAEIMVDDGQRDRALKMLLELADSKELSRYQVIDLAHFVSRQFGRNEAFDLYVAAGDQGDDSGYVEAASIAVSNGEMEKYDAVLEKYVDTSSPQFYELERLWYVLQPTEEKTRKVWLLEKMIGAPGNRGGRYRGMLSRMYLEMGKDAKALALWDDAQYRDLRTQLFESIYHEFSGTEMRSRFLEQFHKAYPSGEASAWMLFLAGEQHYGLYLEEKSASAASARKHRDKARDFYLKALEQSSGRSSAYRKASAFFEQRNMSELAEESLVRCLSQYPQESATWFDYAELLLERGRADAAEQVFYRYIQETRAKNQAILAVAKKFFAFNQHDQAERFYKMALAYHQNASLDAHVHRQILEDVGSGLGGIYLKNGRIDDFLELTSDFYSKFLGQHQYLRPHDRRIDLSGLKDRGLWRHYIDRVEQLPPTNDDLSLKYDHARALWYMGKRQEAWKLFNEYLDDDRYDSGYKWLQLAEFLEHRGGEKLAATAYDRAVRKASSYRSYSALIARANFLVNQGHYEGAIQDFFSAANTTHYGARVYDDMVAAFRKVGREDLAIEASQRDNSPFAQQKASAGLADHLSGEKADAVLARVKQMAKQGAHWGEMFRALRDNGRYEVIATLIEERLQAGDVSYGWRLVMTYADELAAVDRLAPIVDKLEGQRFQTEERGLDTFLVDYYLHNGQPERALGILQRTNNGSTSHIASLQLATGHEQGISRSVTEWLLGSMRSSYSRHSLPPIIDFMRFGRVDLYSSITERVAQIDPNSNRLGQAYVADLLHRRGVRAALAYLRHTADEVTEVGKTERHYLRNTLISGMALLAASGYVAEVRGLIDELPESVREHRYVESFSQRLAGVYDAEPVEHDDPFEARQWTRYQIRDHAQDLILEGRYEEAEAFVLDAIDAMVGRPGSRQFDIRRGSRDEQYLLRQLLGIYNARGDEKGVEKIVDIWKTYLGRDNFSVDALIEALDYHGFEQRAAQVARETAETYQTGEILEKAIVSAATVGDRETVEALMPLYWRQLGMLGRKLGQNSIDYTVMKVDPQVADVLLEPYREARPEDPRVRRTEILVAFRAGDVERGRQLIGEYVDDFSASGTAVLELVRKLNAYDFDVETARVVAPKLSLEELSTDALHQLADANAHIGRYDDAKRYLRLAVDRAANPELEAAGLSYEYTLAGHLELGGAMAERAFAEGGKLRRSYLARGLWRLASGQKGAKEDIDRGLVGRQADANVLGSVASVALQADQMPLAEAYLERLIRLPSVSGKSWSHPLHLALNAVLTADKASWGVAFFDRTVPGFLDAPHLIDESQWVEAVGRLFVEARLLERAERWYVMAHHYERLRGGSMRGLDELLNARALNLALNGGDAKKAVMLSRQAVAASSYKRSEFLITLALAYKRAGDEDAAARTLARAAQDSPRIKGLVESSDDFLATLLSKGVGAMRQGRWLSRTLFDQSRIYDSYRYNVSSGRGLGHGLGGSRYRQGQQPIQIYRGNP
ncbi:tetratricopeptide repeat protein [Persicimonas caeni]|nr:tetratricopeptide repeat protein [Persicimonas caeni]